MTELREDSRLRRRIAGALMAAYVLLVAAIVFAPSASVPTSSVEWITLRLAALGAPGFVTTSVVEFATNVLLFVPLGLLGWFLRPTWTWLAWTGIGFAASAVIELSQWLFLSARSATLVDVAANTLGALIGSLAAVGLRRALKR